ncbi:MAG: hypothetical protein Q9213_005658 [Squamulea squamosa]
MAETNGQSSERVEDKDPSVSMVSTVSAVKAPWYHKSHYIEHDEDHDCIHEDHTALEELSVQLKAQKEVVLVTSRDEAISNVWQQEIAGLSFKAECRVKEMNNIRKAIEHNFRGIDPYEDQGQCG